MVKIWTATTDHNGKFAVGDFFSVDQRTGFINFSAGSYAFDVVTDTTPELGGQLDALTNKIVNVGTPTANGDAANKSYVDNAISSVSGAFTETNQTLTTNKIVQSNVNAMCVGPMAVDNGVILTISANSKLVVIN